MRLRLNTQCSRRAWTRCPGRDQRPGNQPTPYIRTYPREADRCRSGIQCGRWSRWPFADRRTRSRSRRWSSSGSRVRNSHSDPALRSWRPARRSRDRRRIRSGDHWSACPSIPRRCSPRTPASVFCPTRHSRAGRRFRFPHCCWREQSPRQTRARSQKQSRELPGGERSRDAYLVPPQ